ncbi:TPA: UDP-glucose 4-epimerase, partial [Bacillus cereus]|nr:UDP-glucose 4-epimerase [Bacillus cereus]
FADASKAKRELGWEATRGLEEMCADSWRWQSENKTGYQKVSN